MQVNARSKADSDLNTVEEIALDGCGQYDGSSEADGRHQLRSGAGGREGTAAYIHKRAVLNGDSHHELTGWDLDGGSEGDVLHSDIEGSRNQNDGTIVGEFGVGLEQGQPVAADQDGVPLINDGGFGDLINARSQANLSRSTAGRALDLGNGVLESEVPVVVRIGSHANGTVAALFAKIGERGK